MSLKFDIPKVKSSIIKVLGVGGGGGNAVNHMFNQGIKGVDFFICNTDQQALDLSPIPNKFQLGSNLTEGRGAGSNPEVGKKSALETIEDIKKILTNNTKMVFITAGMGGGTGTGAAPIIAKTAKELGILTVGIVTSPFLFEGPKRQKIAKEGIEELSSNVDTLLVISNEKLREIYGNLPLSSAFGHADNILTSAAKGIAEIITVPGYINVDFEDVKTVMANSGAAIMGSAVAEGEDRARKAVEHAINSPLLSENDIRGAKYILLNISSGQKEVLMDEITTITDYIQNEAGSDVDLIWGNSSDENLGEKISVTIIATAFDKKPFSMEKEKPKVNKVVNEVEAFEKKEETTLEHDDQEEFTTELKETDETPEVEQEERNILLNSHFPLESDENPFKQKRERPSQLFLDFEEQEDEEPKLIRRNGHAPGDSIEQKEKELEKLKELSINLRSNRNLEELERVPAYKRKNVKFEKLPHSSETEISRFTLTDENADKKPEIKEKNRFFHDNVD